MDTARCTIDGRTYTALEFSALGEPTISELRYDLVCVGCGHKGYFRKAASSGQGPCFGANPHADTCELAASVDDPWGEIGDEAVSRMEADQTKIILNLGRGSNSDLDPDDDAQPAERPSGRRFVGADSPARSQMQRNPEKLLRMLVDADTFKTSRLVISTHEGEMAVADFFVGMAVASRDLHADQFRAFWGIPRHSNQWRGLRFFNASGHGSLGFFLGEGLEAEVAGRYRLEQITDLRERYVMFIGRPRITSGGSFMMDVPSIRNVAVLPLRATT